MHVNWLSIAVPAYYVFATFVAYLPDPKEGDPRWWYAPLWHSLQLLGANLAKTQVVLKKNGTKSEPPAQMPPPPQDSSRL